MLRDVVVEVIPGNPGRLIYSQGDYCTECYNRSLIGRGFKGFYGWVKGYGAPPEKHLCAVYISDRKHDYGDYVTGQLIGALPKKNGDYMLVFIDPEREESSIKELPEDEMKMLKDIIKDKEYLAKDKAIDIIKNYSA